MVDLRQAKRYAKFMESIGWIVDRKDGINYFIKKFSLVGSFIKIQRLENIDYQYINVLAAKHHAFQIVIEPKDTNQKLEIKKKGYKQSKKPFIPAKTIHIDLSKSEKQLLKEMHHKTRYNIKVARKRGVKIKIPKNIEEFSEFWQECALKQRGMYLSQKKEITKLYKAFKKSADLVFAIHSKELVAGILLLHAGKISYYMYAASSNKGNKVFAPSLAVWEALRISKKRNSLNFDFEGIYDKRFPLKSWKGFTRFKKSFGGKEVEYPGAFTKYRFPI
jgi:lipid II:glycine glycyltransferase (peptidoglycan interpeptide bridge formation enzyme)